VGDVEFRARAGAQIVSKKFTQFMNLFVYPVVCHKKMPGYVLNVERIHLRISSCVLGRYLLIQYKELYIA
jgi:hypothetical protein